MKNIKKIMSAFLVGSMLMSTMVPTFAATTNYTYGTQAQSLYDLGLFKGVSTDPSVFNPDLGSEMDRQSGIVMMLRLIGKEADANAMTDSDVSAALAKYTDANKLADWAKKSVAYAIKNGLVVGSSDTTLAPTDKFLGKMFAALVLRNVGYQVTATNYDAAASTMAEKGGLTSAEAIKFAEKNLIRDDMVGMSYGSLKMAYATTNKTVIQTLVDNGKVDSAKASSLGLVAAAAQSIAEAKQTGAKIFTVKFNGVIDPAKVTVEVKKGAITLNTAKITPAADNKSIAVEMATTLSTDSYAISVTGVATDALTATVSAEEQKVSKIEFASDKLVLDRDNTKIVTAKYTVSNQYGEDLTKTTTLTFNSSVGTATGSEGTVTVSYPSDSSSKFAANDKVNVSAMHASTTTFASSVFTVVDKAQVSDIAITSLYNADNKTLDVNATFNNFWLIVDAKDQYGNKVDPANIGSDVIVSVSNSSIVNYTSSNNVATFTKETINGVEQTVLKLVAPSAPTAGTAKLTIISKTSGKVASYDIVVKEKVKADSISFSSPEFAVAGEKVTVPFTAIDQYGNEIKNASNGLTSLSVKFSDDNVTGVFSQDYVKGAPALTVDASALTEAKAVIMTVVTDTGKLSQLTINFAAPAKAAIISGIKDVNTKLLLGYTKSIKAADNIIIKDQYSRTMDLDTAKNTVVFESSDEGKIDVVNDVYKINGSNSSVSLNAYAKGSATVTIRLLDAAGKDVAGSEYQTTFAVVEKSDIVSYEVADIAKVYSAGATDAAKYAKEVKVYGVLADGSKVTVPMTLNGVQNFNITLPEGLSTVTVVGAKIQADNVAYLNNDTSKDVKVVVTVIGSNATQVFNKTATVTKDAPMATTFTLKANTTEGITKENSSLLSVVYGKADTQAELETLILNSLEIKDQYGVIITTPDISAGTKAASLNGIVSAIATNFPAVTNLQDTKKALDNNTLAAGDGYNVSLVAPNGTAFNFAIKLK